MNLVQKFPISKSILATLALLVVQLTTAFAEPLPFSKGQTVYVPSYSHIFVGDRLKTFDLTTSLAIRNSDPDSPITVTKVDYFDASGRFIRHMLKTPLIVRPVSTLVYVIDESDKTGGVGASFVVTWKSSVKVSPPIVETVMIGTGMQQGISFTSRGRAVRESAP
ncbi:MAG: DUF3124 domain-containing protein [Chlorobiaceae bacterium]|nr:DUF3124 domain-containing protein [Chlorobiaceae bacterium]